MTLRGNGGEGGASRGLVRRPVVAPPQIVEVFGVVWWGVEGELALPIAMGD